MEVTPSSSQQLIEAGSSFEITCRGRKPHVENQTNAVLMQLSWLWIPTSRRLEKKQLSRSNRPPGKTVQSI